MRRLFAFPFVVLAVAACQDSTVPVAPDIPDPVMDEVSAVPEGAELTIPIGAEISVAQSQGGTTECGLPNPGLMVLTGVHNRIRVPADHGCILVNVTVLHSIDVEARTRFAIGGTNNHVGDHIRANDGFVVQLNNVRVDGNITLRGVGPEPVFFFFENTICGASVGGEVRVTDGEGTVSLDPGTFCGVPNNFSKQLDVADNLIAPAARGRVLSVFANTVGFHADVLNNTGDGNKRVQLNTVAGKLRCFGNTPPFVGGPNTAGSAEGQCF